MSIVSGIPKQAIIAINDMLDNCARIKQGDEVLILANSEGLYGGDNLVDQDAIAWIQSAVQMRGINASILWIDEPSKAHAWRFPPILKGAMTECNVLINNTFDLVTEEMTLFRKSAYQRDLKMVRNFATTGPLLCSAWARTPYELVSEIRHQTALNIKGGQPFQVTDDNGTHLEGVTLPPVTRGVLSRSSADTDNTPNDLKTVVRDTYAQRREEVGHYLPWPEWVHPYINIANTNGIFIFDRMLSWWSRYIGISPYFEKPIKLTIENCRITKIEGGEEAKALERFLKMQSKRYGDTMNLFDAFHTGVHPQAMIAPHQCPNILTRRLIEHAHTSNLHFHIGAQSSGAVHPPDYPYWMHCTGDIRSATLRVGDKLIQDRGYLTALDHPAVKAVAAKYPGRPGLEPEPKSW
jgi:hypothetical protein